jgi:hypothetical protein
MGFSDPVEIAGLAAGIAAWVVLFAGFCAWHRQAAPRGPARLVPALKIAAWAKFALSAAGWVGYAVCSLLKKDDTLIVDAGFLFLLPDGLLGMAAIWLGSALSGANDLMTVNSFGWTALTTFIDGALFALVIASLALPVLAWWRFGPALLARLRFSPVRLAG